MPTLLLASLTTYTKYICCFSQNILWNKKYANSGPDLSKCKAYLGVPLLIVSTKISQPLLNCILLPQITSHFSFVDVSQSCLTQTASKRELSLLFLFLFLVFGFWVFWFGVLWCIAHSLTMSKHYLGCLVCRISQFTLFLNNNIQWVLKVIRFHNYRQSSIIYINKKGHWYG